LLSWKILENHFSRIFQTDHAFSSTFAAIDFMFNKLKVSKYEKVFINYSSFLWGAD